MSESNDNETSAGYICSFLHGFFISVLHSPSFALVIIYLLWDNLLLSVLS